MKTIDPKSLSERENYQLLIGSIVPRPIAFVTTLSEKGVLNGAPFSYFSMITANPPMLAISVQRKDGKLKDTINNALHNKAFVVHIADETYIQDLNETAANLPSHQSEVEFVGLTPVTSKRINVPGIQEANIRMECVVEQVIPLGANKTSCDLLIGKVVNYHIAESLYENGQINISRLKPVGRLAGNDYVKLGEMFSLKRP